MDVAVKQWMSGSPECIEADMTAAAALQLMANRGWRHVPVVDARRRLIGVIGVDELRAAFPAGCATARAFGGDVRGEARARKVGQLMTHAPISVREGASLREAVEAMSRWRTHCLPVLAEDGSVSGLLSQTDVLQAVASVFCARGVAERRARPSELESLADELRRERDALRLRLDRHRSLGGELPAALEEADEAVACGIRLGDRAGSAELDAMSTARIEAIGRALEAVERGSWGVCESCGESIPAARLRALPSATHCVGCARTDHR